MWLDNDPRAPRLVADAVCGPQCPQEGVFAHVRGAVGTALRGACATVVCCGPACAGKSRTLPTLTLALALALALTLTLALALTRRAAAAPP